MKWGVEGRDMVQPSLLSGEGKLILSFVKCQLWIELGSADSSKKFRSFGPTALRENWLKENRVRKTYY